ncbi:MAG: sigma 54 modulation/S30EA ribosomal C-terminal domain-containing protein [Oscillospiraceae bacterium]
MFYVFLNNESDQVNVVYHRNDGGYGVIEPNF